MSVSTCAELLYGVQLSSNKRTNQAAVDALAGQLAILQWAEDAARHYAEIRVDLKKKGSMIGANASHPAPHRRPAPSPSSTGSAA